MIFSSIKTRMLALIVGILVATTMAVMHFTQREVERGVTQSEEQSAKNVLRLVIVNIENEYQNLIEHKKYALQMRKKQIEDTARIVVDNINHYHGAAAKRLLSVDVAQQLVLDETKKFRYGNNDYFFIYNTDNVAISHPDAKYMGKDLSNFKDEKGSYVVRDLWKLARTGNGDFYPYWWKRLDTSRPVQKLGYSVFYRPWNWMVGTGVYIDDIEEEAEKKLALLTGQLQATLSKIRIARTGYIFIFNGKKQFVIHPTLAGRDFSAMKDPSTGSPLADELIDASKTPGKSFEYLWDKPSHEGQFRFKKEAYIGYFKPLDWYIVSTVYKDELEMPAKMLIRKQVCIISLIFVISVSITYFLVKRISTPIEKLTDYAKALPMQDFTPTCTITSSIGTLPMKSKDEVGRLAESFIFMEKSLREYIRRLTETTAAKERIESELRIAHDIQMGILPKIFPPFPDRPDAFDLYAVIEPAKEVGGDFYDFYYIDDTHFCLAIGDVSGKGVPSSLFMAVTKTLINTSATSGVDPGVILTKVNSSLSKSNDAAMFATVFLGIVNTKTGEFLYANGGHNPPMIIGSEGKAELLNVPKGPVVGVMAGHVYKTDNIVLKPEDSVFMYTDGVTEAMNEREELFSEERLQEILNSMRKKTIREVVGGVMEEVIYFAEGATQSDDITIMMVRYKGCG